MELTEAQKILHKYGNIEITMLSDIDSDRNPYIITGKMVGRDAFKFALLEIEAVLKACEIMKISVITAYYNSIKQEILDLYKVTFKEDFTWEQVK